jgi:transcriptional regulator with XRE-family HTH domain
MWTLKDAAEQVGVDVQTFWRWEHYEQWPHPYSLRRLCAVFGMSAEELGFGRCFSKISK